MVHRAILSPQQMQVSFSLPVDEPSLLRHCTLSDEDLAHIKQRYRAHNQLGIAVQLFAMRYPGRVLSPGEVIPSETTSLLAAQQQ